MEVDCVLKNDIVINSTWNVESGCKTLKDAVKFSSGSNYELDDIVQVESCIQLRCTSNSVVPCKLHIKLDKNSKYVFTRVDVISEARIIECYGTCEEYLDTVHGEYMDDFEGCTVYSMSSVLPSTQEIVLKFARMKHDTEMWLYGLLFTVAPTIHMQLNVSGVNLSNVNNILKESSRPISEKAEHCKKLLQQCSSSLDCNGAIDPHVLLKMFEGEYLKPLGESSKSMSKCLMRLIPFVMNKAEQHSPNGNDALPTESVVEPTASSMVTKDKVNDFPVSSNNNHNNINNNFPFISNNNEEVCMKTMKDYVDKRMNDMEERLTKKLEQRIRDLELTQNSKLDTIMKLLQAKMLP